MEAEVEKGFAWIQLKGYHFVTIGQKLGDMWYICGSNEGYADHEVVVGPAVRAERSQLAGSS